MGFGPKQSRALKPEQRKYQPGEPFASVQEFFDATANHEYVFMWGKALHPTVAMCQQAMMIKRLVGGRNVRRAIRNPTHPYVFTVYEDVFAKRDARWFATLGERPLTVTARSFTALVAACRKALPVNARIQLNHHSE
jgi:hypothetical protein